MWDIGRVRFEHVEQKIEVLAHRAPGTERILDDAALAFVDEAGGDMCTRASRWWAERTGSGFGGGGGPVLPP